MSDKDQIEIDLEDADSNSSDVEVIVSEEPEIKGSKKEIDPEDGLDDFRAKYEAERAARLDAERVAREQAQLAARAQSEVQDGNLSLVTNAIQTITQNSEILKGQYRDSLSVGDYDRAAEIQAEMATNAARILQLEQGKQALENEPRPSPQAYVRTDPVEALASQLSPRSADWVRRHPEYATDQRLFNKMIAAHSLAIADGIPVDTQEYFENIENTLRISGRFEGPSESAARTVSRRSSPPAAPVSRSGNGTGGRPNAVFLTADEREMARLNKMTEKQYARYKLDLQKEGKIN